MTDPRFLLDSNICIYILTDAACAAALRLSACEPGSAIVSAIAYAEIVRGLSAEQRRAMGSVKRFFDVVPVVPFDALAANIYAGLPFKRARFDRLIAAHALSLGLTLVTNNARDFADIEGLQIENWMSQ